MLNRNKPFNTVLCMPGVGFEQDGKMFDPAGNEIVKDVKPSEPVIEPEPEPVIEPEHEPEPRHQTVAFDEPVIEDVQEPEPKPEIKKPVKRTRRSKKK